MEELAVFKPQRLVVHEVLVRVIADLWVPDGDKYEDLGQNFRRMTSTIMSKYVLPRMDEVRQLYDDLQMQISELMRRELADVFERASPPSAPESKGLISRLGFGRKERSASLPPKPPRSAAQGSSAPGIGRRMKPRQFWSAGPTKPL